MNNTKTLYPLIFNNNLHQVVWGSNRIREWKNIDDAPDHIGESWEVSAVVNNESVITNGDLEGMTLLDAAETFGARLMGEAVYRKYNGKFPLLAKFIGADQDLSIQVHPDDELAQKRHGCFGKNEMWYIIDAKPGAKIYSGFKSAISKYEYQKRVEDGTICDVLQEHRVSPGDMFYIPAGRVHAICGGTLLAEVQQSSDITYRIFDYNRPGLDGKPRQLHTELAADAIDYNVEADYKTHYSIRRNKPTHAINSPYFQLNLLELDATTERHLHKCDSFVIYMCTKGACTITPKRNPSSAVTLQEGFSCLIPAEIADVVVDPSSGASTTLIEAFIDNYHSWHTTFIKNIAAAVKRV